MTGQKIISTSNFYSAEFKQKVAKEVIEGELTKAEASRKYNIQGHVTVAKWIKKYENLFGIDKNNSQIAPINNAPMNKEEASDLEKLRHENERLKQELSFASMRVITLETMIDLAEKELKINIRKKCNTKQSKSLGKNQ